MKITKPEMIIFDYGHTLLCFASLIGFLTEETSNL